MSYETLKNTDNRQVMQPIGPTGGAVPQNINGNTKPPANRDRTQDTTKKTIGIDSQGDGNTAQGMKRSGGNTSVPTPTLNR